MQSLDPLFARLSRSKFRSRFRLGVKERQYCLEKGAPVIEQHAADFVAKRLAPALPANDGKQTPMRGHPVFIAQHATATSHYYALLSGRLVRSVLIVWISGLCLPTGLVSNSQRAC
ncbi:DUF4186 family protein [Escherichia coli]|uniref:DUF4186 family protein n=1 Tax=Escherichia coli TaxID=562 RepID=UPI003855F6BF